MTFCIAARLVLAVERLGGLGQLLGLYSERFVDLVEFFMVALGTILVHVP